MNSLLQLSRYLAMFAGVVTLGHVLSVPAIAGSVTYNFVGVVDTIDPVLTSSITSTSMVGTITVDMADGSPSPAQGLYGAHSFTTTIGGYTVMGRPVGGGWVDAGVGIALGASADSFTVGANPVGPQVNGLSPGNFSITLDGPNSLFDSDVLPRPAPSISSFTSFNNFTLFFGSATGPESATVAGHLTSLTAVPLPPPIIFFGMGLITLISLWVRGRWKLAVRHQCAGM